MLYKVGADKGPYIAGGVAKTHLHELLQSEKLSISLGHTSRNLRFLFAPSHTSNPSLRRATHPGACVSSLRRATHPIPLCAEPHIQSLFAPSHTSRSLRFLFAPSHTSNPSLRRATHPGACVSCLRTLLLPGIRILYISVQGHGAAVLERPHGPRDCEKRTHGSSNLLRMVVYIVIRQLLSCRRPRPLPNLPSRRGDKEFWTQQPLRSLEP
jgi:hypothetical protein